MKSKYLTFFSFILSLILIITSQSVISVELMDMNNLYEVLVRLIQCENNLNKTSIISEKIYVNNKKKILSEKIRKLI